MSSRVGSPFHSQKEMGFHLDCPLGRPAIRGNANRLLWSGRDREANENLSRFLAYVDAQSPALVEIILVNRLWRPQP